MVNIRRGGPCLACHLEHHALPRAREILYIYIYIYRFLFNNKIIFLIRESLRRQCRLYNRIEKGRFGLVGNSCGWRTEWRATCLEGIQEEGQSFTVTSWCRRGRRGGLIRDGFLQLCTIFRYRPLVSPLLQRSQVDTSFASRWIKLRFLWSMQLRIVQAPTQLQ